MNKKTYIRQLQSSVSQTMSPKWLLRTSNQQMESCMCLLRL